MGLLHYSGLSLSLGLYIYLWTKNRTYEPWIVRVRFLVQSCTVHGSLPVRFMVMWYLYKIVESLCFGPANHENASKIWLLNIFVLCMTRFSVHVLSGIYFCHHVKVWVCANKQKFDIIRLQTHPVFCLLLLENFLELSSQGGKVQ